MGKRRVLVVGLVSAVVAGLLVGAVWGVSAYRDGQLDGEAREHVAGVVEARSALAIASDGHETALADAKEHQAELNDLTEQLMAARSGYLDGEVLGAYGEAVDRLDALLAEEHDSSVNLAAPFDAEDPEQAFVDAYRDADSAEREELAAAASEVADRLNGRVQALVVGGGRLAEALTATHRTAVAIVQKLPDAADSLADKYDESADGPVKALREAADVDGWAEVSDDQLADRFAQVSEVVDGYVKAADKARKSHDSAVSEREAAQSRGSSAGGGSSRGGADVPMLCNRWQPDIWGGGGSLVLMPC